MNIFLWVNNQKTNSIYTEKWIHDDYIFSLFVKMRSGLVRFKSGPDFPGSPWTSLDLPKLLLFSVEIMSDKVILDHKKSYLVYFENFNFFGIFSDF